jgi:hypothetical protein
VTDDQLLGEYLSEVRSLSSTSEAERANWLALARGGDATARKRYIESLLLEAATVATGECPPGMRPLDAIQEANVVLVDLVDDSQLPDPATALVEAVRRHLSSITSEGE